MAKHRLSEDRPTRGQGQESWMLEAKDQGHDAEAFSKKLANFLRKFRRSQKKKSSRKKSQIFCGISGEEKSHYVGP